MRIPDSALHEVRERGFTVVEGFLEPDLLAAAQDALWEIYPRPADYFAEPTRWPAYGKSQFAGIRYFPYPSWALSRLTVHPDLVDAAERFLGSDDLDLYKVELWAKYAGAIDYDQHPHRDYGNHTLVVPKEDDESRRQMTTFILLSDVTEQDSPTRIVPLQHTRDIPLGIKDLEKSDLAEHEQTVTGPAGSLLIYRTDVFHRGTDFTAPERSRFIMLVDFQRRGWRWHGKMAWPDHANKPLWSETLAKMSVRERDLFGFPPPGDPYWTTQTLRDVALRYPAMDMGPYAAGKLGSE